MAANISSCSSASLNSAFQRTAVRIASAHGQDRCHTGIACSLNYLIAVRVVFRAIDVGVQSRQTSALTISLEPRSISAPLR